MTAVTLDHLGGWLMVLCKMKADFSLCELAVLISGSVSVKCCAGLQTGVAAELRSSSTVITLSASGRRKSPGQERHITPLQTGGLTHRQLRLQKTTHMLILVLHQYYCKTVHVNSYSNSLYQIVKLKLVYVVYRIRKLYLKLSLFIQLQPQVCVKSFTICRLFLDIDSDKSC